MSADWRLAERRRRLVAILLIAAVTLAGEVGALTCSCDNCKTGDFCVVDDNGGRCYVQLYMAVNGTIQRTKNCYNATYSHFCGTRDSRLVIECCSTPFCNEQLNPPMPTPPSQTTTMVPSNLPKPTLTTSDPTTGTTEEPAVLKYCHDYNSEKPHRIPTHCSTFGSCYRLLRLATNGSVIRWKQGCSDNCVNEERNRVSKQCCNVTLCNAYSPYPSSTTVSHFLPSPSTRESTVLSTSTTTRTHSSSYLQIFPVTNEPSSSTHHLPSSTPGVVSNLSADTSYLTTLALLTVVYVAVSVLVFVLVAVICHKQKQIKALEKALANKRQVVTLKSFDTLTSGDSV